MGCGCEHRGKTMDERIAKVVHTVLHDQHFKHAAVETAKERILDKVRRGSYTSAYGVKLLMPFVNLAAEHILGKRLPKTIANRAAAETARRMAIETAKTAPAKVARKLSASENRLLDKVAKMAQRAHSMVYKGPMSAALKELEGVMSRAHSQNIPRNLIKEAYELGKKNGEIKLADKREAASVKAAVSAERKGSRRRKGELWPLPDFDEEPTQRERAMTLKMYRAAQRFDEEPTGRLIRPAPRPFTAQDLRERQAPEETTMPLTDRDIRQMLIADEEITAPMRRDVLSRNIARARRGY